MLLTLPAMLRRCSINCVQRATFYVNCMPITRLAGNGWTYSRQIVLLHVDVQQQTWGRSPPNQYCQFDCVCTAAADWPCVAAAPQLIASHNAYSIQKCHTCASCKHRHLQTLLCCSYTNTLSCSLQSKQRNCSVQVGSANFTPKRSAKLLYIAMLTGTG